MNGITFIIPLSDALYLLHLSYCVASQGPPQEVDLQVSGKLDPLSWFHMPQVDSIGTLSTWKKKKQNELSEDLSIEIEETQNNMSFTSHFTSIRQIIIWWTSRFVVQNWNLHPLNLLLISKCLSQFIPNINSSNFFFLFGIKYIFDFCSQTKITGS